MTPTFKVKQKVRITRKDAGKSLSGKPFCGMLGVIELIDGEYHYVRPLWYKFQLELYRTEIEPYQRSSQ